MDIKGNKKRQIHYKRITGPERHHLRKNKTKQNKDIFNENCVFNILKVKEYK